MDFSPADKVQPREGAVRLAIVEPDSSVRDAVVGAMSLLGFHVVLAAGSMAEVAADVWSMADVMLLDWAASTPNGSSQWLARLDAKARGRVMLMSVNREGSMVASELSLGGFIEKPMSFPDATERLGDLARSMRSEGRHMFHAP